MAMLTRHHTHSTSLDKDHTVVGTIKLKISLQIVCWGSWLIVGTKEKNFHHFFSFFNPKICN